jgi:hypothetical protein
MFITFSSSHLTGPWLQQFSGWLSRKKRRELMHACILVVIFIAITRMRQFSSDNQPENRCTGDFQDLATGLEQRVTLSMLSPLMWPLHVIAFEFQRVARTWKSPVYIYEIMRSTHARNCIT